MQYAKIGMVDVRDVAAVAVTVLTEGDHEGMIYNLTGPESLSFADVALKLSDVADRPIIYQDVPLEDYHQALLDAGLSRWTVDRLVEFYALWREGAADVVTNIVQDITGRPPRTFDQFAHDYEHVFRGIPTKITI